MRAPPAGGASARPGLVAPLATAAAGTGLLTVDHYRRLPAPAVWLAAGAVLLAVAGLGRRVRVLTLSDGDRQAVTDELTGLGNRRLLQARIDELAAGPPAPAGLLMLDLDRFKEVNDALGHHAGDELLRRLGARLAEQLRPGDLLARLGGDEFAVLLAPGTDGPGARQVAGRLVDALQRPFRLDDAAVRVEATVGVALVPEHADTPALLLRRADAAMYAAKRAGVAVRVFEAGDDPHSRERLDTVDELRAALRDGQLLCHYQPKVDLRTGAVAGVEALARWRHPVRGLLGPEEFLPLAERHGLMRALTLAVLDLALAQAAAWRRAGTPVPVAVNLSVTSLLDVDLPAEVAALLARHGLDPSALRLEVTESVLLVDSARARSVVDALHRLGTSVAIDDYGTGYSSLTQLQQLPVDELKLDRSFVSRLTVDRRSAAIVRTTVDLAHSLGLTLVAEGVQDAATAALLAAFGCDQGQGSFYGDAVPAAELDRRLAGRPRGTGR